MIIGDLLDEAKLSDAIDGSDVVYNFAGLSDLEEGLYQPLKAANQNVIGNLLALAACAKFKVERYIYASTVYVYSRVGGFYRCSKQSAEQFIEEYQQTFGLDFCILRFGSLYGTRSDSRNGVYRVVKRALEENKITYEGDVDAMREYIHVEDAAIASVAAMGDDFKNKHVVLTGQEPMRVQDFLKMIAEILNFDGGIEYQESNTVGHYIRSPYAYKPTIGRKYIPPMHVDLGQGLLELIEYMASNEMHRQSKKTRI